MNSAIAYISCVASHVLALILIAARRWRLSRKRPVSLLCRAVTINLLGIVVAFGTLALPSTGPDDPLQQCGTRIVCFFYAFKLLDLSLTKAHDPPRRQDDHSHSDGAFLHHAAYVWLLLTDMRYHHFDIQAVQKGRPSWRRERERRRNVLVLFPVAVIAYAIPITETKCLLLLCIIQNALEGLHTLLHPTCPHSLFYAPFMAATLGDFWTTHWHASAVFLQSLAYKPGRKLVGRWFGVLAAFALSGAWHGWASAALVDDEHAVKLGFQVGGFFLMLGVGTLLERLLWQGRQGGVVQRVLVWLWSLAWAGWCFRTLECHSKIALIRNGSCRR